MFTLSGWDAKVHEVVSDEARRQVILDQTRELERIARDLATHSKELVDEFKTLNADFDAPREALDDLIERAEMVEATFAAAMASEMGAEAPELQEDEGGR